MASSPLLLTRIFLHNWHRFTHHVIDVEDSLYLAGHNGSGKSSVLDALQLVLIADQQQVRFNSSAQERSQRNLDSYVRGKIGEGRLLRPGNTIAYIALEFTDSLKGAHVTAGICIEAGEGKSPERTFFLLAEPLDPGVFVPSGRPLTRRELRQLCRDRRGARSYDHVGEYRDELLNRLGGLNPRFFELFLRALTFQPIRDIRGFVEQWLLEANPLDIDTLHLVVQRLEVLRVHAKQIQAKLAALQGITQRQREVQRLQELYAQYTVLKALLEVTADQRAIKELDESRERFQQERASWEREQASLQSTLVNARESLVEAEVQLRQSDVVRRSSELRQRIERIRAQATEIKKRRVELVQALQQEVQSLDQLAQRALLLPDEQQALETLIRTIRDLKFDTAHPPGIVMALEQLIGLLDTALARVQEDYYVLRQAAAELRARHAARKAQLAQLMQGRRAYPEHVERLRDLLTAELDGRPPLLCELVEVADERWQDAVEAMLGQRRFNIIVDPGLFPRALQILDQARAAGRIYEAGLLDLSKARQEARPAQQGSLALQLTTKSPLLRAYLDSILGDVMLCEAVDQLRLHRRSVTPDVVVYSEWAARALRPDRYRPWFVGARAQRSQIEACQRDLADLEAQLGDLLPRLAALESAVGLLGRGRQLSNLRVRLDETLDDGPLRDQIAADEADLAALDLSGVEALEREVARLKNLVDGYEREQRGLTERIARRDVEQQQLEQRLHNVSRALVEHEHAAEEQRRAFPHALEEAERLLAQRRDAGDLGEAIRNAESTARNFETRAGNELRLLSEEASAYNTLFQFAAQAGNPREVRYAEEQQRLEATELPGYLQQIEQAQREAEEELREHVLHKLREQILGAQQQLERINDALKGLAFHGERYRFRWYPAEEVREYYDLIIDAQILGSGSLFESEFYERHQATFDQFYEALIRTPHSEADRLDQERLSDYRRYLSYDIEITHADGQVSRLSRIMGQTSGGETQTPFYVTIAASFVQLYHIHERGNRPTLRLVAFDEAFSKMDQDRIGATLDLFQEFKLQIVTATPLERCEYLVPKICTSLVLTGVGDQVLIERYQNYAARLESIYAR